jgi:hypothetical protein
MFKVLQIMNAFLGGNIHFASENGELDIHLLTGIG